MRKLQLPRPLSGGIFLSYKCTNECRHCMYACSPRWRKDWVSEKDVEKILTQFSDIFRGRYPPKLDRIGVNYGVHFTGGEPFLNFNLLLKLTRMASELGIPLTFVETNCFWCLNDEVCEEKLLQLKKAGLQGILVSANPFIVEQVPWERMERCGRLGRKVFGKNTIVYHDLFYRQMKELNFKGSLPFERYLELMKEKDPMSLYVGLSFPSILPLGRVPYRLGHLYGKYSAEQFFNESCLEELTRDWHVHIDNYCNYMTGYCGGISLGNARDINSICQGIDLDEHPILNALINGLKELYWFAVKGFGYKELTEGYISKCHLCIDIRKHIAQLTGEFKELSPREFYFHL